MSVRNPSKRQRRRRWLVQLEILALVLFALSQVFLSILALILSVPVAHLGGWLEPATPGEQWVLTPRGFLQFSSRFAVPVLILWGVAIGIHRWVVRPLARKKPDHA